MGSTSYHVSPVFCDNCSSLALAQFGDGALCTRCLTAIVSARHPRSYMEIAPLENFSCRIKKYALALGQEAE
jgi:hypothetical protein